MVDQPEKKSFTSTSRFRAIAGVVLLVIVAVGVWLFLTRGRETTDDAQVDGYVTPMAARVGGTVLRSAVVDNKVVKAGDILVEIDQKDYKIAVDKARAELADAEATLLAAKSNVPLTSTTATSGVSTAQGSVEQARSGTAASEKQIDAAKARLNSAQAKVREAQANANRAVRDVERLKGLLAKDEVSQQQYDAMAAAAEAQRAAVDSAQAQAVEAEADILVAESRLAASRASEQQAQSALRSASTVPEQVAVTKARVASAEARIQQFKAALEQAELNLQYTTITAPIDGVLARKNVNPGQVIQAGQPLFAVVQVSDVWITANFKETQLAHMKVGQRAVIEVDAYGGREFNGHVDSIAAATGARFSLLPPENATGNYVKVVQRIPVKIVLDKGEDADFALRPGMSVTPTVYTR
jgi:membrane fusion protein (multidrug efflux system)